MNEEIRKELAEIEQMVEDAQKHEEYKEKVFYVREGMLKLTGDVKKTILLSYLIGWTEHWLKSDTETYRLIKEAAAANDLKLVRKLKSEIRQGWFYESYEVMSKHLLRIISRSTAERYCQEFEKKGWIFSKPPEEKTTYRARWYKANIEKIREDLNALGYDLDHFKKKKSNTSQGEKHGSTGSASAWEQDVQYLAFRQVFTAAGADDIKRHDIHHRKYKKAVQDAGFANLILYAEEYVKERGSCAQIALFLSGEWKQVREQMTKQPQQGNKLPKLFKGKLPSALKKQEQAKTEQSEAKSAGSENSASRQAEIRAKLKLLNERFGAARWEKENIY